MRVVQLGEYPYPFGGNQEVMITEATSDSLAAWAAWILELHETESLN